MFFFFTEIIMARMYRNQWIYDVNSDSLEVLVIEILLYIIQFYPIVNFVINFSTVTNRITVEKYYIRLLVFLYSYYYNC